MYPIMDSVSQENWFDSIRRELETAYLAADTPWGQSGFAGPYARWEACRRPIADCIISDGTFLDIGCANGYLLECLLRWTAERGISLRPWGLDISENLAALARKRLPQFENQIITGNSFYWKPPRQFDYVRTELCYVPQESHQEYISRLMDEFLLPTGRLLVAEYRSSKDPPDVPWVDKALERMDFAIENCTSGSWEGGELTRVAVIAK